VKSAVVPKDGKYEARQEMVAPWSHVGNGTWDIDKMGITSARSADISDIG